ncbi:hypothetical protein F5Y09DRAFT_92312 [Xylaria sp. FL1042]|nr:hypothetical protein F5Y09DRAFT_92312 [Xylaria sp. FL1042]
MVCMYVRLSLRILGRGLEVRYIVGDRDGYKWEKIQGRYPVSLVYIKRTRESQLWQPPIKASLAVPTSARASCGRAFLFSSFLWHFVLLCLLSTVLYPVWGCLNTSFDTEPLCGVIAGWTRAGEGWLTMDDREPLEPSPYSPPEPSFGGGFEHAIGANLLSYSV